MMGLVWISSQVAQTVRASTYNAGDPGSIPGLGRSPGEGNGTPLQYSCLENPMDGGAWQATVHGVAKSRTRLSDFTFTCVSEVDDSSPAILIPACTSSSPALTVTCVLVHIHILNQTFLQIFFISNLFCKNIKQSLLLTFYYI